MVVVVCCCFLCLFLALGEGASRNFGHECEPFLCVDVDCHEEFCACVRSDLYDMLSSGFSLKDTS